MSSEERKVPELRFKGFTDDWEQRKLGDMGEVLTGNTPSTKDASNWNNSYGKTWITPTDIKSFKTSISERKLSDIGWKKSRNVPANSVLITSIASIGKNTINTVPAGFNQQINAIIPKDNDKYFILNYMERYKSKFIGIAGKTATSIINKSDFLKFPIKVPSLDEQIIVGTLFNQIDELIELHLRLTNKLQDLKQELIRKLIPKTPKIMPELRFIGINHKWQYKNLDELLNYEQPNAYIVNDTNYSEEYATPVLTAGKSLVLGYTSEKTGIKQATRNEPVIIFDDFTTSSHYIEFNFKVKSSAMKILSLKNKNDHPYFIYTILKNVRYYPKNHERHWISITSKFAVPYTNSNGQRQIGNLIYELDSYIEKYKLKIELLYKLKSSYLQKMFL